MGKLNDKFLRCSYLISGILVLLGLSYTAYYYLTGIVLEDYAKSKNEEHRTIIADIFANLRKVNCSKIPTDYTGDISKHKNHSYGELNYDPIGNDVYNNLHERFRSGKIDYFWLGYNNYFSTSTSYVVDPVRRGYLAEVVAAPFTDEKNWGFNRSFNKFHHHAILSEIPFNWMNEITNNTRISGRLAIEQMKELCDKKRDALGVNTLTDAAIRALKEGKIDIFLTPEESEYIIKAFRMYSRRITKNMEETEAAYKEAVEERIWFHVVLIVFVLIAVLNGLLFKELRRRRIRYWGQYPTEWRNDTFGDDGSN